MTAAIARPLLGTFRAALALLALAIAIAPFIVLFVNSIRPADEFLSDQASFISAAPTFDHYRALFDPSADTLHYFVNSLIVTASTTVLAVTLGTFAAYALARLRLPFRLSAVIAIAFLVVRFYPKIAIAIPYYLLMRDFHWLDTRAAIVFAHVSITIPFVVWLMLTFFEDFPHEIEQSAMLDGCGPFRRLIQIVLPLTRPALISAAILTAFLSWNEFLMASAVGLMNAKTLPVRVSSFITDKGILWGDMSAMSSVIVVPVMLFALLTQRYLVRGLAAGAVKG